MTAVLIKSVAVIACLLAFCHKKHSRQGKQTSAFVVIKLSSRFLMLPCERNSVITRYCARQYLPRGGAYYASFYEAMRCSQATNLLIPDM